MHLKRIEENRIKLMLRDVVAVVLCIHLCACSAVPLADRKIIRAIFFETNKNSPSVTLLMQKQDDTEFEKESFEAVSGTGQNYREAWQSAEDAMEGKPFYGLLDAAILPQNCNWQTSRLLGNLITEIAAPIPEISLFVQGSENETNRKDAYQEMIEAEKMYQFHWGLETLMADENEVVLPFMADSGYGCIHICKNGEILKTTTALASQQFAILNGRANSLQCRFMHETQAISADATVYHHREQGTVQTELLLRNVEWRTLKGNELTQYEQESALEAELKKLYETMQANNDKSHTDPFHLEIFMASYGKQTTMPPFQVIFEP